MAYDSKAFSEELLAASEHLLNDGLSDDAQVNEKNIQDTQRAQRNLLFLKSLFTRLDDETQSYTEFKTERDNFLRDLDSRYGISGDPAAPKDDFQPDPAKIETMLKDLVNQKPEDLRILAPIAMKRVESKILDYANPKSQNCVRYDAEKAGLLFTDKEFTKLAESLSLSKVFHEEFPPKKGLSFVDSLKRNASSISAALKEPNNKLALSVAKFGIMAASTGGASLAVGGVFVGISALSHPKVQKVIGTAIDKFDDYLASKGIDTQPVKNVTASLGTKLKGLLPKRDGDKPMSLAAKVALGVAGVSAFAVAVAHGMDAADIDFSMPTEEAFSRVTGSAQEIMDSASETVSNNVDSLTEKGKDLIDHLKETRVEFPDSPVTPEVDVASSTPAGPSADQAASVAKNAAAAAVTEGADSVVPDVAEGMTELSLPKGGNIWRSVAEHIQQTTGMKPQTADIVRMTNQVLVENDIKDATKLPVGFTFSVPTDAEQFVHGDTIDRAAMDNILLASGVEPTSAPGASGATQVATKPEAPAAPATKVPDEVAEVAAAAAQASSSFGGAGAEKHVERAATMLAQSGALDHLKEYAEKLASAEKVAPKGTGLGEGP